MYGVKMAHREDAIVVRQLAEMLLQLAATAPESRQENMTGTREGRQNKDITPNMLGIDADISDETHTKEYEAGKPHSTKRRRASALAIRRLRAHLGHLFTGSPSCEVRKLPKLIEVSGEKR